jgi:hypothetical protein
MTTIVAVLLGAAVVVGLGTGVLLGVAGDGGTTTATGTTPPPASTPTSPEASPSGSPTTRAASQIERGTTKDVGYYVGWKRQDDGVHVTFDRVIFRTGRAARSYARQYHKPPPGPDGILLVNDNELKRDLVLSPDVRVLGTQKLAGTSTPSEVTVQTLLDAIDAQGSSLLLDMRYDDLGYVVEVREHALP